jgi:hypothetical protein
LTEPTSGKTSLGEGQILLRPEDGSNLTLNLLIIV